VTVDKEPVRWCPSCKKEVRTTRETCPICLADLRDAPGAAIACVNCGHLCDAEMVSCPECLATVRSVTGGRLDEGLVQLLAAGTRMLRPASVESFRDGPYCELTRFDAKSSLVLAGRDNLVEAYVGSRGNRAAVPMFVRDTSGEKLFRIATYDAAPRSLVAFDPNDTPIAIYQRDDVSGRRSMLIRDETSAPAARLNAVFHGEFDYELIETGAGILAGVSVNDTSWFDDAWRLHKVADRLPFKLFGAIGMLLAAKVFFGRIEPEAPPSQDDEASDITDIFRS
jgi:hypothetical protein